MAHRESVKQGVYSNAPMLPAALLLLLLLAGSL